MKKFFSLIIILMFWICISPINAATLKWDASTGEVSGYNVYFSSDGIEYYKDMGDAIEVVDIDSEFNLYPGNEYIFTVTAYNSVGESNPSNVVIYMAQRYTPSGDNLPATVLIIPGPVTIIVE